MNFCALAVVLTAAGGAGCNFSQTGISPPTDRIFLPGGIVPDPAGDFLYVVNSNSDLRYNAGTVVAVKLREAVSRRAHTAAPNATAPLAEGMHSAPRCAKTRFSRSEPVASDYCCWDLLDGNTLNCNEPQFIQSDATIQIGSFGGSVRLQRFKGSELRRLFMAVRAEPSITYADVAVTKVVQADGSVQPVVSMRCTGAKADGTIQPANAYCDDQWKILRPGGATPGSFVLPEEPHVLWLDDSLGALFVGHLTVVANKQVQGGGVSSIDICTVNSPQFAGLARAAFPLALSQAIGGLSSPSGSSRYPTPQVYATARNSTAISGLVLRDPNLLLDPNQPGCDPTVTELPARDLTLVPSDSFNAPAFLPNGINIRGVLFSSDPPRAYVLHRNDNSPPVAGNPHPGAIAMLDRHVLADGRPANSPISVLPVCNGPTEMKWHDAGRGARIYVTCYDDGQIFVVDPLAFVVTAIIDAGAAPISLVFSPSNAGEAYVASFSNSHLSVIDLAPGSPTENRVVQRIGLPHGFGQ